MRMVIILPSLLLWAVIDSVNAGVSSKVDFSEESETTSVTNSSRKADDDDVEVKHTIVVSTKLKNSNRRGIHISDNSESGRIINTGRNNKPPKEVPVVKSYRSVESTMLRSEMKRPEIYPDSYFINRNIGDNYDTFPNIATSGQWKPSTLYNNVNWWNSDVDRMVTYNIDNPKQMGHRNVGKFHRTISDESMRDFYCCKCKELSRGAATCSRNYRSAGNYETTTKLKVDGKIAKLD